MVEEQKPSEIKGASIGIQALKPGDYLIEWRDTRDGRIIRKDSISLRKDTLYLSVPPFRRDIACKIKRQE